MSPFEHGEVFVLDDGGEVGGRPLAARRPPSGRAAGRRRRRRRQPAAAAGAAGGAAGRCPRCWVLCLPCTALQRHTPCGRGPQRRRRGPQGRGAGAPVARAGGAPTAKLACARPPPQVDLDLGNYERFLDITLTRDNNITTGKIYQVGWERGIRRARPEAQQRGSRRCPCWGHTPAPPPPPPPPCRAPTRRVCSTASGAATTWARRCRLCRTSPTPSRTGSSASRTCRCGLQREGAAAAAAAAAAPLWRQRARQATGFLAAGWSGRERC
jgi:hypothetical protein